MVDNVNTRIIHVLHVCQHMNLVIFYSSSPIGIKWTYFYYVISELITILWIIINLKFEKLIWILPICKIACTDYIY